MQTLPVTNGTPPAEVEVNEELVRRLLEICHPDLSDLPVALADSGWDNFIFRLGDNLAMRLPRRESAVALIVNEQQWLPRLAPSLPVTIPCPVRCGTPNAGFPWPWSIVPWIEGETSDTNPIASDQAETWTSFLNALHLPAPEDAPANPYRGIPLRNRCEVFEQRLKRLSAIPGLIPPEVKDIWQAALDTPESNARVWIHGDLHGRNVLNIKGRISGVIDWGDLTAGDPATDLSSAWALFDSKTDRQFVLDSFDPDLVLRARGWAALLALAHLEAGLVDSPQHKAIGERILTNLLY